MCMRATCQALEFHQRYSIFIEAIGKGLLMSNHVPKQIINITNVVLVWITTEYA